MMINKIICHPGEYLIDAIDSLEMTPSEFAIKANISLKTIDTIIKCESNITFEVASRLAAFFGYCVDFWVNLQASYDTYLQGLNKYC